MAEPGDNILILRDIDALQPLELREKIKNTKSNLQCQELFGTLSHRVRFLSLLCRLITLKTNSSGC